MAGHTPFGGASGSWAQDRMTRNSLDEIRRLLYMALFVARTEHYELAGTIVNALLHHGMLNEVAPDVDVITVTSDALNGDTTAANSLLLMISRITEKIETSLPAPPG